MKTAFRYILLLVTFWLPSCKYKKIEYEETLGYRGPARTNAFLAAERFLDNDGYHVIKDSRFDNALKNREAILITPLQSFVNYGMAADTLHWVQEGGHLVLFLNGGQSYHNDWDDSGRIFSHFIRKDSEEKVLLEKLGIENAVTKTEPKKFTATVLENNVEVEIPRRFSWKNEQLPDDAVIGGDKENLAFASYTKGYGRITLIADAQPFRNRYIDANDHAWLLSLLLFQHDGSTVYLVQGVRLSFFGLLWESAWMAILALAVVLIIWLWKNYPRLGPMLMVNDGEQRQFTDHLTISGGFLWKHHQSKALLIPMQRAIFTSFEKLGWHRNDTGYYEKIAARAGLPVERVQNALMLESVSDPQLFQRITQDLQKIRETI